MEKIKVVLIDDDEIIREGLKTAVPWNDLGFSIVGEANNGKNGIEIIMGKKPNLVILDIKMPVMDGLEVCKIINGKKINTKILLLSGYSDFEYARTAMKEGVLDYVLKPVYLPDFIKILNKIKDTIYDEMTKKTEEIIMEYKALAGETAVIDDLVIKIINNENKHDAFKKLELMEVSLAAKMPTVALIELEILKGEHKIGYRKVVQEAVKEYGFIFQIKEEIIGIIFSWEYLSSIKDIFSKLKDKFQFAITMGIGTKVESIENISQSYKEAEIALKHKFYEGKGKVICYTENLIYTNSYIYSVCLEDQIFQSIVNKEMKELNAAIKAFINSFQQGELLETRLIFDATIRLLASLESRVIKIKGLDNIPEINDRNLIEDILSQNTYKDLICFVEEYIKGMADYIKSEDIGAEKRIIFSAISYMEKEYLTATLSEVAKNVFVSPNYLSFLFKMEIGMTFVNKLTEIRINKAKELLKSLKYKTYEVAEMVGYSDSRYFSQVFKRKTGYLPSEYHDKTC